MQMNINLQDIPAQFDLPEPCTMPQPFGCGLVHRSYLFSAGTGRARERFILQQINTFVFREPVNVMENIERVLKHIQNKMKEDRSHPSPQRSVMELIPSRDGKSYMVDQEDNYWRIYRFIEGCRVFNQVENIALAREAGRMFGRFSRQLSDMDPENVHITIPRFHDLAWRFEELDTAAAENRAGRLESCRTELDTVMQHKHMADSLDKLIETGGLPIRVTHNDTKINNVLMDEKTGRGLCVIDLDTIMPSTILSDFGDMTRTFTPNCNEEEPDTEKLRFRLPVFEAMASGFLREAGTILTPEEKEKLVFGGRMLTLMQAVRFLTDHLNGDVYYSIRHPGQNLQRARNQFRLLQLMDQMEEKMRSVIQALS